MSPIACLVFACVFVDAVVTIEPREVNIALETVLRFDKKDQQPGIAVIDKVQNALEKIRDNLQVHNARRSNPRDLTFAEFVVQAARILMDYNDNDLEDVFAVIGDESRKYVNRESELQELLGSGNIRRHLDEQLDTIKDLSAFRLRRHLGAAINAVENKDVNGGKNDIIDIGSFLYIGASSKFKAALRNLERLKTATRVHVENVIKDTLKSLIFDHYSNLNSKIKRELIQMAKDFWKMEQHNIDDGRKINVEPRKATRPYYKRRNKHVRRHRHDLKAEKRYMRDSQSNAVHATSSSDETGYEKKYTNQTRGYKDRHVSTTYTYMTNAYHTDVPENIEEPTLKWVLDDAISFNNFDSKRVEIKTRKDSLKSKSTYLNGQEIAPKFLQETEEHKPGYRKPDSLFSWKKKTSKGGINLRDPGSRHQLSREESNDKETTDVWKYEPDKTEEKKEQDLSDAVLEYHTEPFLSVEKFTPSIKKMTDETDSTRRSEFEHRATEDTSSVTLPVAPIQGIDSAEGLAIDSTEHKEMVDKDVRKNIEHDKLHVEGVSRGNMKRLIKNIEKEIDDVKDQFDYVKNLPLYKHRHDTPTATPKFKSIQSEAPITLSSTLLSTKTDRIVDSDSLERNNEEFISHDILEAADTGKKVGKDEIAHGSTVNTLAEISNETEITTVKPVATKATIASTAEVNVTLEDVTLNFRSVDEVNKTNVNNITNVETILDMTRKANIKYDVKNEVEKLNKTGNIIFPKQDKNIDDNFILVPRRLLDYNSKDIPDEIRMENLNISENMI